MKKHSLLNRVISLVLSLVLVASCLPAGILRANATTGQSGIVAGSLTADASTLNAWADTAFNPEALTTEHAGGVWTDKSVLQQGDIANAFPGVSGLDIADKNFLVALSALGANSVVSGQGTTPTDTVFVLDVSNSMEDGDLLAMVNATNDAIHTLLQANEGNRVGVVVYATDVDVLLPLDRYTPVTKTTWGGNSEIAYIEMNSGYSSIRTARVTTGGSIFGGGTTTYVKDSNGNDVRTSISASGATYIQGGLWEAYEMFDGATVSDSRAPVLVLMSDGAPTYGTEDYNAVSSRDVGNGASGSVTDGLAFLTQLTAAYVKEKIADKYNTSAYLYSVGLGVSEDGQQVSIAEAVLDTSKTRATPESHWNTYLALANQTNQTMSFSAAGENVSIAYDPAVTESSKAYTDRYFPASDASQLSAAFQGIVNEISLKSSYNVTRLDGVDVNTDGYVTFVDEIGAGMEVKNIKGILIGSHLFSGELLAKATEEGAFGTEAAPTALGLNQIWALENRLRISDTATETASERVWALLRQAKAAGQIRYSANDYSNYLGWFGDADGKFVGFWNTAETNPVIPAGAAYANMCYGMLGATSDSQTAHASDMMYVAITVSKEIVDGKIKANTPQTVTFRVPASLLPTVTYQIDVQAANDEEITENTPATITYNPAQPIRLLYEVGVHSQLNALNIQDFLREGYQAKDADGNYYLYTNAWYWEPSNGSAADFANPPTKDNTVGKDVLFDTSKNHITYSYFEPGQQNEHYYFTEDTPIYVKNGNAYEKLTTAPVTDGSVTYYFQHKVFTATATQTATKVNAQVDIHYGKISSKLLENSANITQNGGVYYIKEGTMHYETIHDHDKEKTLNATGSFGYRLHQLVDIAVSGNTDSHHYEIMYLGNNGRLTYAPAQGLKISKVMNDGTTPDETFTFEVALTPPAGQTLAGGYETVRVARNGSEASGTAAVAGGKLSVSLMPGESVYILGLPKDTAYAITETKTDGYLLSAASQDTGVIVNNTISEAVFTNMAQQYGALTVSKWVTYKDGLNPTSDSNEFEAIVTLKDGTENFAGEVMVGNTSTAVTDGKVSFKIRHNQEVLISNIPVGVTYEVAEVKTSLPKGYTWTNEGAATLSGAITEGAQAVELTNEYDPDDVTLEIGENKALDVVFDKYLDYQYGGGGFYSFSFTLRRYNPATTQWATIGTRTISFVNPQWNALNRYSNIRFTETDIEETFTAAGEYFFRLEEIDDPFPGLVFDHTHHDFKVTVTDSTLDGKLEIASVEPVDETVEVITGNNSWSVRTEFNNRFSASDTSLSIQANKKLTNTLTNESVLKDGQFSFGLYETDDTYDITGKTPVTVRNGANGDIVFPAIPYKYSDLADGNNYHYYVLKEQGQDGNGIVQDKNRYHIEVCLVKGVSGGDAVAQISSVRYQKSGDAVWTVYNASSGVFKDITFENTYTPNSVKENFTASKTLTNLTPGVANTNMDIPADTFSFKLEAIDNAPMPASSTATAAQNGTVTFGDIQFTKPGIYQYKVTEQAVSVPGVTRDATEYTAVVTVTDNGLGQLEAQVSYLHGDVHTPAITFHNTYSAAPTGNVVLGGGKELTVEAGSQRELQPGEFFFTLTAPDGSTETVSNSLENGRRFAFSPITFDTVGTYTYTIQEVVPQGAMGNKLNGVTYAPVPLSVPIEVYDDGSGVLKVRTPTGNLNSDGGFNYVSHFENSYEAAATTIGLSAHKDLEGKDLQAGDFTFRLTPISGAPMPDNYTDPANDENGNVSFGQITYNAVGTYRYRVTENVPSGAVNNIFEGVTYSQKEYTVTVTVADNGIGNLVAHVSSVDEDGDAQPGGVVFTNTYATEPVKAEIKATKKLYNQTGGANNEIPVPANTFYFNLEAKNGAPLPQSPQVSAAEGGAISFGEIEFAQEGTYAYALTEVNLGWGGMAYDSSEYTVQIKVRDNQRGKMEIEALQYIKDTIGYVEAVFTNKYAAAPTSTQLVASKTLTNLTPGVAQTNMDVPADTFKFKLESPDAPLPQQTEVYAAADGTVTFPAITFILPGTYTYTLSELDMQVPGVTTDNTVYTVTVKVKDDGAGQLAVESVTYAKPNSSATTAAFENTYLAAPIKIHVEGDDAATDGKIFTDESSLPQNQKDLNDFVFHFTLAKLGGTVVQTVEDNGQGFAFDAIEFTEVGQYQYVVYEHPDNDPGVTYDYAKYRVTVTVTDGGNGQLDASVKYEKAESGESDVFTTVNGIVFENSYKAKETSVTFAGKKTLTGRTLQDKEFFFILKDARSGQNIEIVQNDADGNFSFLPFTYNAEGTYTYTLEEKNDGKSGITYDSAKYTLTVTVVDENGELKATTVITKDGQAANEIAFANVYTPEKTPEKPENDNPKTGDNFQMGVWTLMLTVSAVGLLAVLLLGRKKEETAQ